jgi:hypothetical protein
MRKEIRTLRDKLLGRRRIVLQTLEGDNAVIKDNRSDGA